jgi:hypothetical protein
MCGRQLATKTTQQTSRHHVGDAPRAATHRRLIPFSRIEFFLFERLQLHMILTNLKIFASTIWLPGEKKCLKGIRLATRIESMSGAIPNDAERPARGVVTVEE